MDVLHFSYPPKPLTPNPTLNFTPLTRTEPYPKSLDTLRYSMSAPEPRSLPSLVKKAMGTQLPDWRV